MRDAFFFSQKKKLFHVFYKYNRRIEFVSKKIQNSFRSVILGSLMCCGYVYSDTKPKKITATLIIVMETNKLHESLEYHYMQVNCNVIA